MSLSSAYLELATLNHSVMGAQPRDVILYTTDQSRSVHLASGLLDPAALTITGQNTFLKGDLFTSGNIVVEKDILPFGDEVVSLGSVDKKFKDLFLSGSTIHLGSSKIQDQGGYVAVYDSNNSPSSLIAKEIKLGTDSLGECLIIRYDDQNKSASFVMSDGNGVEVPVFNSFQIENIQADILALASQSNPVYQNVFVQDEIFLGTDQDIGTLSDRRVKADLLKIESALDKIRSLTGYTYKRTDLKGECSEKRQTGLIAQDVQSVLPEAVYTNEQTELLSIAYGNMMGLVINAVNELHDMFIDLKQRI